MNDLTSNLFHKKTFFPSSASNIQFSNQNDSLFYSTGNKIVLYDILKGIKSFRLNLNQNRIVSFCIPIDKAYVIDANNSFYEYDFSLKAITATIQLNYNYSKVIHQKNKFYLFGKDMHLAIAEIIPSAKGTTIKLQEEYLINVELTEIQLKYASNFKVFDVRNEYVILSKKNVLVIHNLITKKSKQIEFQKKIISGCLISNQRLVIGDVGGKMHFISEFSQSNYIISTKHWHSHKVNSIILDSNENFLYSGGEEGVIVIWNLHNDTKTFIPRINNTISSFAISNNSKYLSAQLLDGSIKIISLSNMKLIQEINTIDKDSIVKRIHMFNEEYLVFGGRTNGLIQFYNINQNSFPFELNIMNKNFVSQTEREDINKKQLNYIHIIYNKDTQECYMATIEELYSGEDDINKGLLITYLKFWKITNDSIDLITQGENAHLNESIEIIEGRYHMKTYMFLTGSKTNFKLWTLEKNDDIPNNILKFTCAFNGEYKDTKLHSCLIGNKNIIYALHGHYLIKWNMRNDTKGIDSIYSFSSAKDNEEGYMIKKINKETLCLYNDKRLIAFSIEKWDELWCEEFNQMKCFNILNDLLANEVVVIISNQNECFYCMRYDHFEGKKLSSKCEILYKKGISFIDLYKGNYLIVNNKRDIFISSHQKVIQQLEEVVKHKHMTKKELDDNDIIMETKPRKNSKTN